MAHALDRHVALIGFMGAGKTTAGEQVARLLGRPFADSDTLIEKRSGKTIGQLFEEEGEGDFRLREAELISELLSWRSPGVFALGGGSPTIPVVRRLLADSALTIVLSRCAITILVQFRRSRLAVTLAWVGLSSALVASSKNTIRGLVTSARAIINR